jgi:hypothetical protein
VLDPPIPGFSPLCRGIVSLLHNGKDDTPTALSIEAVGVAGERVRDPSGRTLRKTFCLQPHGVRNSLFRANATGQGALIAYLVESRLVKPIALAAILDDPAAVIYGGGARNCLGICVPPEPTIVIVEDARPQEEEQAAAHDRDMERAGDRLLLANKIAKRTGGPPCGCCKDIDEALGKHPIEELRAWINGAETAELGLDGWARKCARIAAPLRHAQAIAEVIEKFQLRKKGTTKGCCAQVAQYAGKSGADFEDDDQQQEQPPVQDVIPWPHPVDGAEVLDAIVDVIQQHVSLPPSAAHAAALWAGFSHALDLCWFNPRLAICSPVKRCGKTTLVEVLAGLVARAKPSSGVTPAVVFRMIDLWKPTYLIDEADGYLPKNEELRSVLNSGHTRTSAQIDRNVSDADGNWAPKSFSTWCPLVVAGIGRLPGTLDDRSIKLRLQRKPRAVKLVRFRTDRIAGITELGRKLARFVQDNQISIGEADVEPPEKLHDPAADNWRPLLAIAAVAGGAWPERAAAAALALEGPDSAAEDLCVELLADVRLIFILGLSTSLSTRKQIYRAIATDDYISAHKIRMFTTEIMAALFAMPERPWNECNNVRPLSQRGLASLLQSFSIATHKNVRRGARTGKGYILSQFLTAFSSYLPPLLKVTRVTGSQPKETAGSSVTHDGSQTTTEKVTPDAGADVTHTAPDSDPSWVTPKAAENSRV